MRRVPHFTQPLPHGLRGAAQRVAPRVAMDGVAEMFGYPPATRTRGVHTLYLMPDLHIEHGTNRQLHAAVTSRPSST